MRLGRLLMGAMYVTAGLAHFALTPLFASIVPDYLPAHRELVLASGVAEIAGGLGVIYPPTRRAAAWGLVVMLVAVFPANVWMARHPERWPSIPQGMLYARLPLQVPLIWWAWSYTRRRPPQPRLGSPQAG